MASLQKIVLMTQALQRQGEIWHEMLTSQDVTVIWETIDADLVQVLTQMHSAGLPLPDLLLVDMGMRNLNPYTLCQTCRQTFPELNIILTVGEEKEVAAAERQWAIYQGAKDLLPGMQQNSLITGAIACLNRVLEVLELLPMRQDKLMPVLAALSVNNVTAAMSEQPLTPVSPVVPPSEPNRYQGSPAPANPTNESNSPADNPSRRRYRGASY
mgnify:CR=1 FL=1